MLLNKLFASKETVKQNNVLPDLIKSILGLIKAIDAENELLEAGSNNISYAVRQKITRLKEYYLSCQKFIEYTRQNKLNKTGNIVATLQTTIARLNDAISQNEFLLWVNLEVASKMVDIYKNTNKEKTVRQYGYNNQGAIPAANELEKIMPALSLSNKI